MKPKIGELLQILLKDKHHPIIHDKDPFEAIIAEIKRKLPAETESLDFHRDDIVYGGEEQKNWREI